jgi:hypothetical protein
VQAVYTRGGGGRPATRTVLTDCTHTAQYDHTHAVVVGTVGVRGAGGGRIDYN